MANSREYLTYVASCPTRTPSCARRFDVIPSHRNELAFTFACIRSRDAPCLIDKYSLSRHLARRWYDYLLYYPVSEPSVRLIVGLRCALT